MNFASIFFSLLKNYPIIFIAVPIINNIIIRENLIYYTGKLFVTVPMRIANYTYNKIYNKNYSEKQFQLLFQKHNNIKEFTVIEEIELQDWDIIELKYTGKGRQIYHEIK